MSIFIAEDEQKNPCWRLYWLWTLVELEIKDWAHKQPCTSTSSKLPQETMLRKEKSLSFDLNTIVLSNNVEWMSSEIDERKMKTAFDLGVNISAISKYIKSLQAIYSFTLACTASFSFSFTIRMEKYVNKRWSNVLIMQ